MRAPPLSAGPTPPCTIDLLLDGPTAVVLDGREVGFAALRRALRACEEAQGREGFEWLWYTSMIAPAVWDDAAWNRLTTHLVEPARGAGVLLHKGQPATAAAVIDEAEMTCDATGTPRIMS